LFSSCYYILQKRLYPFRFHSFFSAAYTFGVLLLWEEIFLWLSRDMSDTNWENLGEW
jgi:hypothetical protein